LGRVCGINVDKGRWTVEKRRRVEIHPRFINNSLRAILEKNECKTG
jgi:hypothetical protein